MCCPYKWKPNETLKSQSQRFRHIATMKGNALVCIMLITTIKFNPGYYSTVRICSSCNVPCRHRGGAHLFLTSMLDWIVGQYDAPAAVPLGKDPPASIVEEAGCAPGLGWMGVYKRCFSAPTRFELWIVQPVASCCAGHTISVPLVLFRNTAYSAMLDFTLFEGDLVHCENKLGPDSNELTSSVALP